MLELFTFSYFLPCLYAFVGCVAFAVSFNIHGREIPISALGGAVGWLVYLLFKPLWGVLPAIFLATFAVLCISRFSAVQLRCPATIFLIAGIFPLVPGLGIYQTAYAMVNNATAEAGQIGFTTLKTAIAMVLAILLGLELPGSWFRRLASHWSK